VQQSAEIMSRHEARLYPQGNVKFWKTERIAVKKSPWLATFLDRSKTGGQDDFQADQTAKPQPVHRVQSIRKRINRLRVHLST
jgi:hypothetical protein